MASYTSAKASQTISSKADSVDFTFDISSAIAAADIAPYSKITKVNITVWGDINTATNTGKMNAYFGSEQIGSETKVGGTANEKSVSENLNISTFFYSETFNAGDLKDTSARITVNINGPVMLSKFNHTASWQITIEWEPATYTFATEVTPKGAGTITITNENSTGIYNYRDVLYVTATANAGYKFVMWEYSNGGRSSRNPDDVFMQSNLVVTAIFEKTAIDNILANKLKPKKILIDKNVVKTVLTNKTKSYG